VEPLAEKTCVAFNSLGYLKHEATLLCHSPYIHCGKGIFLRKSYITLIAEGKVKLHPVSKWTQADAQFALV
jgi:hypothetical protein